MSHIHAFAYKDLAMSADEVWDQIIDIDRRPELIRRIRSIERIDGSKSGQMLRVGSKYIEKAGDTTAPGRSYTAEVTVTEVSSSGGGSGGSGRGIGLHAMKSGRVSACSTTVLDEEDEEGDGGCSSEHNLHGSSPNSKGQDGSTCRQKMPPPLPLPRTLAISMMEVPNSHRRATATFTVEALPDENHENNENNETKTNKCRLCSTLAIVPNGFLGRVMFVFLSCCINRSMTADLLVDLDDIAECLEGKRAERGEHGGEHGSHGSSAKG